jgi:hypothetical protein
MLLKETYLELSFTCCIHLAFWEKPSCRFVNGQKPCGRIPTSSEMWLLTYKCSVS